MINNLKGIVSRNLVNIPGFRTNRKIVVFESDDWGSIRMPSIDVFNLLKNKNGSLVSHYDSLDSLEKKEDVSDLFNLLSEFKDYKGQSAKFTFNSVMTNPDFAKIRETEFDQYFSENFSDSYENHYGQNTFSLWKQGIEEGLMKPQYHALQHLNRQMWMNDLKKGNSATRLAFDYGFFGLKTKTSSILQNHYLATYYAQNQIDLDSIINDLKQGLIMFKKKFGFKSDTFIASNYTWSKEIEKILFKEGVRGLQSQFGQIQPSIFSNNKPRTVYHYTGQINEFGQVYSVRNVNFEPYQNQNLDWVDKALNEISNAFFWGKPAIICTHRINYVSILNLKNKEDSLKKLHLLISKIIEKYPDVEFLDSSESYNHIKNENSNT
jgi:hypothetical protein